MPSHLFYEKKKLAFPPIMTIFKRKKTEYLISQSLPPMACQSKDSFPISHDKKKEVNSADLRTQTCVSRHHFHPQNYFFM